MIEDGGSTSLGLEDMDWTTGAEVKETKEVLSQIDNEDEQTLRFEITVLPDAAHGEITMNGAGPRRPINVGQKVTEEQLKSAEFSPTSHFNGKATFSYKAIDSLGAETAETIEINVLAINDDPILEAGDLNTVVIPFADLAIADGETEFTPITLNGQDWIYNTGGNESTQALTFTAIGVPDESLGLIVSGNPADGIGNMRKIEEGESFTRAELDQLHFAAAQGGSTQRRRSFSSFSFAVTDNGDAESGGPKSLIQNISILVSVEGLQTVKPSQLNDLAGKDVTQEHLDELNEAGFEVTGTGGLKIRDPEMFSRLSTGDPNFMKRPGGETSIGGAAANYITTALPFDFTLNGVVDSDANRPFTQTVYEVMYVPDDGVANKDVNNIEVRELYRASPLAKSSTNTSSGSAKACCRATAPNLILMPKASCNTTMKVSCSTSGMTAQSKQLMA